jgi:dTDP-3-amino-3,4,6-trideoxy-alpha-D-glucose transaminase
LEVTPVPLARLDNGDPDLLVDLLEAVEGVARQAAFTGGAEVEGFEVEFAAYCDAAFAVGVGSGTDALALALRALGIGPGDEVILPANSFIATAEAVTLVGAEPRLVDVDPRTQLLTAAELERAIGPRTRAVIPVHLYGRTVEMEPLLSLARRKGLLVLEDACQAHGARYKGRRVGSLADAGCFSFYPAKNLGGWGDGGAVVTSSREIAERVQLLRSHGERPRYHHRVVGSTARLDAIQAAVLRVKLRRLDGWNDERRGLAGQLDAALQEADVTLPAPVASGGDHVYHQYVIETDARDAFREHLNAAGVATGIHYPVPIHRTQAYAALGMGPGSLPTVERLAGRICSLPIFPGMTRFQVGQVAKAVADFGRIGRAVAA